MAYVRLKPTEKTPCFAIEDISGDTYLFDHNPKEDMIYPDDVDLLYREIVEGVFYPVKKISITKEKKLVGYFFDELDKEYKCVYEINSEFSLDADIEWLPITKEILESVIDSN